MDLVLENEVHDRVYRECGVLEPELTGVTFEAFCREYVSAKLALGCVYWVSCCARHRIEDKDLKNLYFKEVMGLFESPKSLDEAARFSESLFASNADREASPVIGVLVHLFHKLGLEAVPEIEEEGILNAGFHFMTQVSEALKVVFETKFDDFYFSHENDHIPAMRKKGLS